MTNNQTIVIYLTHTKQIKLLRNICYVGSQKNFLNIWV